MSSWVIFTDLDGTLLDRDTYSFEAARPALETVKKEGIPLIICTSKTRAETLFWWKALGLTEPFIIESGGAVVMPHKYFVPLPAGAEKVNDMFLIPLGARYGEVLRGLKELKVYTGNAVQGFSDMSSEEVARETCLPLELAGLARQREFDEPFKFLRDEERYADRVADIARKMGLSLTKADRFYHLHGDSNKGKAVKMLEKLLEKKLGRFKGIGIGDSEHDLYLLQEVDVPILLQRFDGSFDPVIKAVLPRAHFIPGSGPKGWNKAILSLLEETKE